MKKQKKNEIKRVKKNVSSKNVEATTSLNQYGITLIALVISIIVMLILAGVSINAIVGENGILNKAQTATFAQKIAGYKEEMEMNIVGNSSDFVPEREKVTAINDNIKKYIPSIEERDIGKFGIIAGELYYLGNDELEKQVCINQNIKTKTDDQTLEDFIASVENDALESIIKNLAGDSFKENNDDGTEKDIGVKLYDKNIANANRWKIIIETENGVNKATYGTDWNYVEAGKEIDGIGVLSSGYIINYKTSKAVKFDATKHTMLGFDSALAVSDSLVYNLDPAIIESANSGDVNWKDGIDVYGYKDDYSDTFTNYSIKFDGNDDYFKIPGNLGNVAENGLTFEFYGLPKGNGLRLDDVTDKTPNADGSYDITNPDTYISLETQPNNRTYQKYNGVVSGIFSLGKIDYGKRTMIKFLFRNDSLNEEVSIDQVKNFYFNYGQGYRYKIPLLDEDGEVILDSEGNPKMGAPSTEWLDDDGNPVYNDKGNVIKTSDTITPWSTYKWCDSPTDSWNQCINLKHYNMELYYGDELYYAIVINPKKDTQAFYVNGELIDEVQLNTNAWKAMTQEVETEGNDGYWFIGRATENAANLWNTYNGEIYSMRLYERPLSSNELKANYNATMSYHNILIDSNTGGTSGETGGEDIENIN